MTSQCGKNKKGAHELQASVSLMVLPHFDAFCDLSLNRHTEKWNLFVLYNEQKSFIQSQGMPLTWTAPRKRGLLSGFSELWDDKLTWEEIRSGKLRPWGDRACQEPPSPVLFPSQSCSSVSTPVPPESPVPSTASSGGSVVASVVTPAST